MRSDELRNTMASVFTQEATPAQAEQGQPAQAPVKRRRKSFIEKEIYTEPKPKRTRRKKDPEYVKSHTLTVLMTESMFQKFKSIAQQQELSMNGIVTRLIRKYIITHDVDLTDLD